MVLLQACAGGKNLRTVPAKNGGLQGTYALILYGGTCADDFEEQRNDLMHRDR